MQEQGTKNPGKIESAEQRRERLAAELRTNLLKRKARSRAASTEPSKDRDGDTQRS